MTQDPHTLSPLPNFDEPTSRTHIFGNQAAETEDGSLREIFMTLKKRQKLIAAFTIAGLLAGILLCIVMPANYESTALILVDKAQGSGDLGAADGIASLATGDDLKTEMDTHLGMMTSNSTYLTAAQSIGLLKNNTGLRNEERVLQQMRGHIKATQVPDTRLINITASDHSAAFAAEMSNTLADTYISRYLAIHFNSTAQATGWLSDQLKDLKSQVETDQQKLIDYERKNGLAAISPSTTSGDSAVASLPALDKLNILNRDVTEAEAARITKESIYRLTQSESPDVITDLANSSLTTGAGAQMSPVLAASLQSLQALRSQEIALKVQYASVGTKYGASNPRLQDVQNQVRELEEQMSKEIARIRKTAKQEFVLAQSTEAGLRSAMAAQEKEIEKLNDKRIELQVLAGEAQASSDLYRTLYNKLQQARVQAGVKATNLSVVDPARQAVKPYRPNWIFYPLAALGAGFLVGLMAAFLLDNLRQSINSPEDIEAHSDVPMLTYIPRRTGATPTGEGSSELIEKPQSSLAESYRSLRTALLLTTPSRGLQALLITSPLPTEGKTTVSYNLSIALAQNAPNGRVLLIDADMRKPRIHVLSRVSQLPGLSTLLSGGCTVEEAIKPHPIVPNLSIIPAGNAPPMSLELLASDTFSELMAEFRKQYDFIVIDSAPVLPVADALVVSEMVDGTALVVRSSRTPRKAMRRAVENLQRGNARMLGIVLNDLDLKSVDYYNSYGYYGDSYYGE
jgi:capsular exopolysaccharide synthesis family protein